MTLTIKKVDAVPGFVDASYAVIDTTNGAAVRLFRTEEEAKDYVDQYSKLID